MFEALETAHRMIQALSGPVQGLQRRDPDLHRQIKRAANSVTMNLAEGRRRAGKDRLHLWRVAAGSAAEVRSALRNGIDWGDLEPKQLEPALELLDRVIAMTWTMTR